jgi:hypothetical protein
MTRIVVDEVRAQLAGVHLVIPPRGKVSPHVQASDLGLDVGLAQAAGDERIDLGRDRRDTLREPPQKRVEPLGDEGPIVASREDLILPCADLAVEPARLDAHPRGLLRDGRLGSDEQGDGGQEHRGTLHPTILGLCRSVALRKAHGFERPFHYRGDGCILRRIEEEPR